MPDHRCARASGGRARAGLLLVALLVSACTTLGPDHREPEVDWLAAWQPELYGSMGSGGDDAATLARWWRRFDDPALDALVAAALEANPGLRVAGLRILESRAQLGRAERLRYPQLTQATGSAALVDSAQSGGAARSRDDRLASYEGAVFSGWELDFWGRFRRGIESADAAYMASIVNYHDARVLLVAQVADTYVVLRTLELSIEIARRNVDIQQRSFELATRRFERGQDSELDLQQARAQYLATRAAIPGLETSLVQTRNALATLLGRAPGDLPELPGEAGPLPDVERPRLDAVAAELLLRRPDIRVSAWQVAAQSALIGVTEADLYPAISLQGAISVSSDSLGATPNVTTAALGPGFSWNILDRGIIRNNVRVQDARLQQAIQAYQQNVLVAAAEIDSAAIAIAKTEELESILAESVAAAERALELADGRFREGYVRFNRVLDAQRALFAQESREITNRGDHLRAIIALYRALGGGWETVPLGAMLPAETLGVMESNARWGAMLTAPLPEPPGPAATSLDEPP
jgi:NodT family efflux transporter outer membrane factor (OMF) lipoprotein